MMPTLPSRYTTPTLSISPLVGGVADQVPGVAKAAQLACVLAVGTEHVPNDSGTLEWGGPSYDVTKKSPPPAVVGITFPPPPCPGCGKSGISIYLSPGVTP